MTPKEHIRRLREIGPSFRDACYAIDKHAEGDAAAYTAIHDLQVDMNKVELDIEELAQVFEDQKLMEKQ